MGMLTPRLSLELELRQEAFPHLELSTIRCPGSIRLLTCFDARRKLRRMLAAGITLFVDLTEEHELKP